MLFKSTERFKMRYENNICDGCKKRFADGDDIVVCPFCGTPQHRECYEKNNECVNAALHESGFSWQGEVSTPLSKEIEKKEAEKKSEEALVCPSCGHENPPGSPFCEACGQKFTFFGVNLLEKEQRINREIDEEDRLKEEMEEIQQTIYSGYGTTEDIEKMIDTRAKVVAPGLTKEQEQEMLCGHPIKRVLVFTSGNCVQYANKFRKIEHSGSHTWNWAAFFFAPFWFFYRKLYKIGTILLSIRLTLSLAMLPFMERFESFYTEFINELKNQSSEEALMSAYNGFFNAAIPIYIIAFLIVALSVVSALIADRVYKKFVTQKLDDLAQVKNPLIFSHYFIQNSGCNALAAVFALAVATVVPNIVTFFIN